MKRSMMILTMVALMVALMTASAVPAFALNPQPLPPEPPPNEMTVTNLWDSLDLFSVYPQPQPWLSDDAVQLKI
jgi:hypothetical protein